MHKRLSFEQTSYLLALLEKFFSDWQYLVLGGTQNSQLDFSVIFC
jgi:hypothetical protein